MALRAWQATEWKESLQEENISKQIKYEVKAAPVAQLLASVFARIGIEPSKNKQSQMHP